MDERGFFAADKRSGSVFQFDREIEPGSHNIFSQQAGFFRLLDGDMQPLDGQRIFGADINKAGMSADGIAADRHCLEH